MFESEPFSVQGHLVVAGKFGLKVHMWLCPRSHGNKKNTHTTKAWSSDCSVDNHSRPIARHHFYVHHIVSNLVVIYVILFGCFVYMLTSDE